jgi:murein DD-endopeptidase MepM/ murein hydrolase activator NlpD
LPGLAPAPAAGESSTAPPPDSPEAQEQRQQYDQQQAQVQLQLQDLYVQYGGRAIELGGGSGLFTWPELSTTISQGFGCTEFQLEPLYPECPTRHRHTGVDVVGPDGTPVFAAAAGVARTFASNVGYGNFVVVIHSDQYATLYGHLRAFTIHDGEEVQKGDVIGLEGSTGLSTGPHLHFEIRHEGDYVDPIPFFLPQTPVVPLNNERGRVHSW